VLEWYDVHLSKQDQHVQYEANKDQLCFPAGMNPQGTEAVTIGQL